MGLDCETYYNPIRLFSILKCPMETCSERNILFCHFLKNWSLANRRTRIGSRHFYSIDNTIVFSGTLTICRIFRICVLLTEEEVRKDCHWLESCISICGDTILVTPHTTLWMASCPSSLMVGKTEGRFADMTTISCIAKVKLLRTHKTAGPYLYFVVLPFWQDVLDVRDILMLPLNSRF